MVWDHMNHRPYTQHSHVSMPAQLLASSIQVCSTVPWHFQHLSAYTVSLLMESTES